MAEAEQLAAAAPGGFLNRELAALLQIDYRLEKPLYVVALGNAK